MSKRDDGLKSSLCLNVIHQIGQSGELHLGTHFAQEEKLKMT